MKIGNLSQAPFGELPNLSTTPDNLPEVDFSVDKPSNQQIGTEPKYNLRRAIKAPTKPDL